MVLLLSIATWNVPGFFGSIQSSLERVRWKQGHAAQLLAAHKVVALQEAHGNRADLSVLAGRNHAHHFFGTFCELVGPYDNSRAGGVVLAVDEDLSRRVGEARVEVSEEGTRMIAVFMGDRESFLLLIAVHIDPMKIPLQKRVVVDAIRACCDRHPGAWVFCFGGFNFSYRDDSCVSFEGGDDGNVCTPKVDPLSDYFDDKLCDLVELHQPDFIHCRTSGGRIRHLSRIERVYTNVPSCELLDMWAVATARGKFGALPSDHLPVSVRLVKKPTARSAPVVRPWIAKSEAFSEAVEKLWKLRAVSSAVGSRVELEDCFRAAAREVAVSAGAHVKGLMKTKLYAATLMVRAVRSHDTGAARRALSLFPALARYVGPSSIQGADVDGLYSFAARLNRADVENDLAAMAKGCNDEGVRDDSCRDVRKASTLRRSCAWRLRRPRVGLRSIVGAEGGLAPSPDEAGKILAKHWQPVFEAREIDSEAADRFLSHVCAVEGGVLF